ncbi:perlucin-like [Ylistrum balloti]|uniref:perlucin-like n=1 Tax=Ylistrum balloti TaxID=509963 RepID=UPI002905EB03|nr:perlucin-like [Ylistrum balloti]
MSLLTYSVLLVLLYTVKVSGEACPNGWTRHDASCYFFVDIHETWQDASAHCEALDSQLASIQSEREDVFLRNTLHQLHVHDSTARVMYWLDGTDIATETEWTWAYSEEPITKYTHWCPHQPDNANANEDCLRLGKFCDFGWDDGDCETKEFFICERHDKEYVYNFVLMGWYRHHFNS